MKRILVADDGAGIRPGDARLAFQRHATSKVHRAEDLEGNPVSTQVDMPFGATSVQVVIDPVPDTIHEYPESLVLTLQPDPAYGLATNYTDAIRINDAKVKAETETLFVGLHYF